jgi:hypothetical protein
MFCLLILLCARAASGGQAPALPEEVSLAVGETMLLVADVRRAARGSRTLV